MTEIPADIRQTAERLADKLLPACDWQTTVDLIAQALLEERMAERERSAKLACEVSSEEIKLACGEMTAQEMRSVKATLRWRAAAIRSQP